MGFFDKLKKGLLKTKDAIVGKIDNLFKAFAKVDEELFEELKDRIPNLFPLTLQYKIK